MLDLPLVFDLVVAALVGMAVGIEREWSGHTIGPDARFAGIRTFALLGTIGGFGGWFLQSGHGALAAVIVGAAVLFPVIAYWGALRRPGTSTDGTTEVVAMLVVALGAAAGMGERTVASAVGAVTVVLLHEKSALQRGLEKVAANELRAALQFAVLALVVLPLLPNQSIGPYGGFNPRQLWGVVLLFSGLNFAGYIARRAIGETRGLGVTGLLGGLVSSTAVSLTFSRRSREEPALGSALALGVVAACTVLLPRIVVIAAVLNRRVALAAVPLLAPAFVAGLSLLAVALWREQRTRPVSAVGTPDYAVLHAPPGGSSGRASPVTNGIGQNPLGLGTALQMAVGFQLVLYAIAWLQQHVGTTGVLASAVVLGFTDVDALTASMTRYGREASLVPIAATAMAIGVLSNTALKLIIVTVVGAPHFRSRAAFGLLTLAAGSVLGLWIGWPAAP